MTSKETKKWPSGEHKDDVLDNYSLILHNDDIHSFDYVIDALIEICSHGYEQAVQCTLITHHKGSCTVRKGEKDMLYKMKQAFNERELSTTIKFEP